MIAFVNRLFTNLYGVYNALLQMDLITAAYRESGVLILISDANNSGIIDESMRSGLLDFVEKMKRQWMEDFDDGER